MCSSSNLRSFRVAFVPSRLGLALRTAIAVVSVASSLGGCAASPVGAQGDEDVDSVEEALCPAPDANIGFATPTVPFQNNYPNDVQPANAVAGDFNGDGLLDAVFISDGSHQRLVYMAGNGVGLSGAQVSTLSPSLSTYNPQGGAALDYDGDGDLDIAYVTQGGTSLIIAYNDGAGSFTSTTTVLIPSTYAMKRVATGDFNGDGRPDIAMTANVSRTVRIVLNLPTGPSLLPAISTGNGSPWDISAVDMNLDGQLDLVVGLQSGTQPLFLLQGQGDGTFVSVAGPLPKNQGINGAYTWGLTVADLDADGRSDVAYVEANTRQVHVMRNNSSTGVSLANEVDSSTGPYPLGSVSLSEIFMAAGDFDVDGRQDLAVIGKVFTVGTQAQIVRGTGVAGGLLSFSATTPWLVNSNGKTSTTPRGLIVGPFNVQSCGTRPDIVFSSNNDTVTDWSVQYVRNVTE